MDIKPFERKIDKNVQEITTIQETKNMNSKMTTLSTINHSSVYQNSEKILNYNDTENLSTKIFITEQSTRTSINNFSVSLNETNKVTSVTKSILKTTNKEASHKSCLSLNLIPFFYFFTINMT